MFFKITVLLLVATSVYSLPYVQPGKQGDYQNYQKSFSGAAPAQPAPQNYDHHGFGGQYPAQPAVKHQPYEHGSHDVAAKHSDNPHAAARTVQEESDISPDGSFHYSYNADNGISAQQEGTPKQIGEHVAPVFSGSFSYKDEEGHEYQVTYTADENGYQPQGAHLPTPPPIPEAIARGLQYIQEHPSAETTTPNYQDQYQNQYHQ